MCLCGSRCSAVQTRSNRPKQTMTHDTNADDVMHRVMAETRTDHGSTIRLRGYGPADEGPSEWRDVVEIETPAGETIQVGEWDGGTLEATQRYNAMVRPYTDDEGNEVNE